MTQIDECGTENFSTPDDSEETVAILGDRWWSQKAKPEGERVSIFLCVIFLKDAMSTQALEVRLLGL